MARHSLLILLLSFILLTDSLAAQAPPPVPSRAKGDVRLASGGAVLVLQAVPWGSTLSLGRGAEVVLVCAGDRTVRLVGPVEWPVEAQGCATGDPVTAGTYSRLQPRPGRVRTFHGHLLAEAPSRSDDQTTKVPVIVSPTAPHRRVMAVEQKRPEITWSGVDEAMTYELVLHRGGQEERSTFGVLEVSCSPDLRTRPAVACSKPWPWAPLRPGEEVRLEVLARTPDPDWPVRQADAVRLRLADSVAKANLTKALMSIRGIKLDSVFHLQRASIYQEAGFYNAVAMALAKHLEISPSATVATRLADLYLSLGLVRAALNHYQHALQLLPPRGADGVRAEVELGTGRVYARREDPQLAALHLEKALDAFRRLQRQDAVAEVAAELELVRRSLR